jgi:putative GTP pyrophosphokinase
MDIEKVISEYKQKIPLYEGYMEKLVSLLEDVLTQKDIEHIIEHRVKKIESFEEKISREDKDYTDPLHEITDICGIRIITPRASVVEAIIETLTCELKIDTENSVIKSNELEINQFGYLSSHLIVSLDDRRSKLTEWKTFVNLKAEIQIRTQLQHAWAQVSHKFNYKSSIDIPAKLQRKLFRLSALFELADEELETISDSIKENYDRYISSMNEGDISEDLNVDSLKAYIEKSDVVKYWQDIIQREPQFEVESWGNLSRDIQIAQDIGLSTISEMNQLLNSAKGWGEDLLQKYCQKHLEINGNRKTTMVLNGIVTLLMIAVNTNKFTKEILENKYGIAGLASYYIAELISKSKAGKA